MKAGLEEFSTRDGKEALMRDRDVASVVFTYLCAYSLAEAIELILP